VERLDLLHGTLDVVASLGEVHGTLIEGPTKTGHNRTVAVPRFLARMLTDHLAEYPSRDGHVFSAPEGGPLRHRAFMTRTYRPTVKKTELPQRLRFHDLRHTCAALLIAAGAHLEEIKDHLGHASIRTTSDRYGHLYDAARDHLEATYVSSAEATSSSA
jgi:integrase